MTTTEIKKQLSKAGKSVETAQLYRYFRKLGIKQSGFPTRPANYPDDTPARILSALGRNGAAVLTFQAVKSARRK